MGLLWKIIRKHLRFGQLAGYFLSSIVGVSILLFGICFYSDVSPLLVGNSSLAEGDYVVLTKTVTPLRSLKAGRGNTFSDEEIRKLEAQGFADEIGKFRASDFSIYAEVSVGGMVMSTDMFFESVPDSFVDAPQEDWDSTPEDGNVPVIIPRNYLDLYNFAFAPAQGLPQLSEELVKSVDIVFRISGRQSGKFTGRIVGLSNRINTILVPDDFLAYANETYGYGREMQPLRLILKTDNAGEAGFVSFMNENGYMVSEGKDATGRVALFLKAALAIMAGIGLLISVISLVILVLGTYLVVEKNRTFHAILFKLGYSPWALSCPYVIVVSVVNFLVAAASTAVVGIARNIYSDRLDAFFMDMPLRDFSAMYPAAFAAFVVMAALASLLIYRRIASIENQDIRM